MTNTELFNACKQYMQAISDERQKDAYQALKDAIEAKEERRKEKVMEWEICGYWIVDKDSSPIAFLRSDDYETNANIIAAAPRMMQALETIVEYWTSAFMDINEKRKVVEQAREALKAAKGEGDTPCTQSRSAVPT